MPENLRSVSATVEKPGRPAVITPDDSVTYSWGTVIGDGFRIDNAALTLSNNGQGDFTGLAQPVQPNENSVTLSGFGLHDGNGLELYRTAPVTLVGGFENPSQNAVSVLFPAYMYGYITTIVLYL